MEQQRNSRCWYVDTCQDNCDTCVVYTQLAWQMNNSGLPAVQQKPISLYVDDHNRCDRDAFIRLSDIRKDIVNYIECGNNLYICGNNPGNGKTSWSIKLLQTYFHHTAEGNYDNLKGMFVSTVDLLLRLKDFNNPIPQSYRQHLEGVDVVVFDDIAVTGISQYDFTQLYSIINNRIFAGKSNIFTSNVTTREQLEKILGTRLASRIYGTSEIIELKGMDRR